MSKDNKQLTSETNIDKTTKKEEANNKSNINKKDKKRAFTRDNKLPNGFELSGIKANVKYKNRYDLALIYSQNECNAAGVWTQNSMQAACISYNKAYIQNQIRAIMINSGYANACTGIQGDKNCLTLSKELAKILKIESTQVLLSSTGVIGEQLPMNRISRGIPKLVENKSNSKDSMKFASRAIMTTDTYPKTYGININFDKFKGRIWGMAKGSGMIHPNMATLLGFILTDIDVSKNLLQEALKEVVQDSFNQISVDGDTSTNDMIILLSNKTAKNQEITEKDDNYKIFKKALAKVCIYLAKEVARDGEGATHLLEVFIKGAKTKEQAQKLSKAIIASNLVKTAIFGNDANWGRIICAMGYSKAEFDASKLHLIFASKKGEITIVKDGVGVKFNENKAKKILSAKKIRMIIDLNDGKYKAKAWGCDLSHGYIQINADYRS
ncbi:bifunctional glutamate N-acetyltransferase/amino-acid acetyltransferase ArgJ [Helicobacter muridarum]|uniref:Arginine biosynthesis bifunctional protein ArgJ n=1 Tax=Helicobacter muridarum TaxID=216 RepID=A0A377PVB9_9HELI|nr:bifunctional glutamate N-acetyltransferase/amino-acid acetyltransferase ArgJ [Helicobacter muridarum]TLE00455.1 bifunctional glutamate N-acetyltransferase/amino-acid acetyltransferase ArgJ [Helicobacter muridarum]STQ86429.1 arginine biosynthesis [Helicobacter muridarum]